MKIPMALALGAAGFVACNSTSNSNPTGPVADNSLHKTVSFSVSNPNSSIETGRLTLSRADANSPWIYWMLPVTNSSYSTVSLIEFDSIAFIDALNRTITTDLMEFVTGSVMKLVATGTFTNSCLQPSETGYLFGLFEDQSLSAYTHITSATAQTVTYLTSAVQLPKANVKGVGFSTTGAALSVTVANTGTETAQFDTAFGANFALLRDNQSAPVYWTLLYPTTTLLLAPGDSCTIADYSFNYSAQFSDLFLFPYYSDLGSTTHKTHSAMLLRGAFDSREAFVRALIARRNSLEAAKRLEVVNYINSNLETASNLK